MNTNMPLRNPKRIREMFSSIAHRYDKTNTYLSAGIHHLWRKKLVNMSKAKPGDSVLDCATGTGDLAIAFKKCVGNSGHVIGTDFCPEMLASAPAKAEKAGCPIRFEEADVTNLQFQDKRFDITSIAFGIRNVSYPIKALQEMARVTKPGGSVMILEFGQPSLPVWKDIYFFYSHTLLPKIGGWLTGASDAYSYLEKSSASFPCNEAFIQLCREADCFSEIEMKSLTGGVAYMYKARVR